MSGPSQETPEYSQLLNQISLLPGRSDRGKGRRTLSNQPGCSIERQILQRKAACNIGN
jgi:hypothetical protein